MLYMSIPIEINYINGSKMTQFELNRLEIDIKTFLNEKLNKLENKIKKDIRYCTITIGEEIEKL